jgi:hypothetical protein
VHIEEAEVLAVGGSEAPSQELVLLDDESIIAAYAGAMMNAPEQQQDKVETNQKARRSSMSSINTGMSDTFNSSSATSFDDMMFRRQSGSASMSSFSMPMSFIDATDAEVWITPVCP